MPLTLSADSRKYALVSLKRFWIEKMEGDIGELQAMALLDFFLKEIGPSVYNSAVADVQVYVRDRLADLDGTIFEPEFTYWPKGASVRRKHDPGS